ncbi:MAG: 16S rRNA (guanine(966)-N(2))-methyltransferase RsmD [Acidobacteriota bacterium]
MRVIAGRFRSRVLQAPAGLATRPSSDRLRETLFNVLTPRMEGARFLDLYAGSGAVGIEALSRGAAEVVFVERAAAALTALRANLEKLGIRAEARVQAGTVCAFLSRIEGPFDVVFLDPPYDAAEEYESTLRILGAGNLPPRSQSRDLERPQSGTGTGGMLAEGAVVVVEHRRKDRLEDRYGDLTRTRLLQQGDAALSFYQRASAG